LDKGELKPSVNSPDEMTQTLGETEEERERERSCTKFESISSVQRVLVIGGREREGERL